jgi:magnesium-transporting ATPase (P-type)
MTTKRPIAWHGTAVEQVLATLQTSRSGLATAEASRRLAIFGPNALPRARRAGPLELLARQFLNPLQLVLLGSGLLGFLVGRPVDGVVVVAVVVVNSLIGAFQELRASRTIEALSALVPDFATVLRDGFAASVDTVALVPGDVALLQAGDRVAADMRVLTVRNLQLNEAALTGESLPTVKTEQPVSVDAGLAQRTDMLFAGTTVVTGTARAVVTATGMRTELGRIALSLQEVRAVETPLMRQLAQFGALLTQFICAMAFLVYRAALARGHPLFDALRSGVSIAVAAIPSGLPAIITVTLAVAVRHMAKRNAVVRALPSVETLGSATVICSDKTGTLTRGEMTVRSLWTAAGAYDLTGVGYVPRGELQRGGAWLREAPPDVVELLVAATVCNDATLEFRGSWVGVGDPTEIALVVAAEKIALTARIVRAHWRRVDEVPFEAAARYMATLHESADGEPLLAVKGAPEVVVALCDRFGDEKPIDRVRVLEAAERLASHGMRVLAIAARTPAERWASLSPERLESLRLLGLVGMIDAPRPEAIEAIDACHRAGIVVKMVTGDHPATAKAVGVEIGIAKPDSRVVTGEEIERTGPSRLQDMVSRTNVWARVEPEHKLRLVQALQARGEVVVMTGDGVNDAPALKQADVGVAMGITGTGAVKEVADVVLVDDNFASIAAAVRGGRRCYDNIVKAVMFVVPTNLGQALAVALGVLFFPVTGGVAVLPIIPLQILWVNLATGVTLGIPLAFEAEEEDVMRRPPRPRHEPIFTARVGWRCVIVGLLMTAGTVGLFLYEYYGRGLATMEPDLALRRAQSMAATTLVFLQLFYLLQCRSLAKTIFETSLFSNRVVYVGIAVTLAMQVAFVSLSTMNRVFHTAPLEARDWAVCLMVAASVVPPIALQKVLYERRVERRAPSRRPGTARTAARSSAS